MKNLIAPAVIGLLCMTGGFYYGMKLMPKPAVKPVAAIAADQAAKDAALTAPHLDAISIDTLKKTSEDMMNLNEALRLREQAVALREQKIHDREDELNAERSTLDASHERFKTLYKEFQDRLLLVEDNQAEQLQKQSELFSAMGTDQAIDLIRAMDDGDMARLFSIMEVKPLAKTIAAWKTKYPTDAPRLLHVLDAMSQVMPKSKIALSDTPATSAPAATDSTPAPAAPDAAPGGTDATPAPAADPSTPTPPATDSTAPATTPSTNDAPSLSPPPESDPTTPAKSSPATSTASNF